jgi:hypothetical protein
MFESSGIQALLSKEEKCGVMGPGEERKSCGRRRLVGLLKEIL